MRSRVKTAPWASSETVSLSTGWISREHVVIERRDYWVRTWASRISNGTPIDLDFIPPNKLCSWTKRCKMEMIANEAEDDFIVSNDDDNDDEENDRAMFASAKRDRTQEWQKNWSRDETLINRWYLNAT